MYIYREVSLMAMKYAFILRCKAGKQCFSATSQQTQEYLARFATADETLIKSV